MPSRIHRTKKVFAGFISWGVALGSINIPVRSFAEEKTCAPQELQMVYPDQVSASPAQMPAPKPVAVPVTVQISIANETLRADFEVHRPPPVKALQVGEFPYQKEAVEVFLSVAEKGNYPYFEYELGPFDQDLQVKIPAENKKFIDGVNLGLRHHT